MKQITYRLLILAIVSFAVLACNALFPLQDTTDAPTQVLAPAATQGTVPLSEAGVPRVTVQDTKAAFDNGEAILVDVRSQAAYDAKHIAGAILVPLGAIETDIASIDLPKDEWIITYCT